MAVGRFDIAIQKADVILTFQAEGEAGGDGGLPNTSFSAGYRDLHGWRSQIILAKGQQLALQERLDGLLHRGNVAV